MVHLKTTWIEQDHCLIELRDICRHCAGTGEQEGQLCPTCEGSGMVLVTKDIQINVKPYKAN